MNYETRHHYAHEILCCSALEAQNILVLGGGIWLQCLEQMMISELHNYNPFLFESQLIPSFYAIFQQGGMVKVADFGPPTRSIEILEVGSTVVPDLVYLVEDSPGDNIDNWIRLVGPYLHGTSCPVVILGDYSANT